MGMFSSLMMYLRPAMSRAIDPRTDATKPAMVLASIYLILP